MSTPPDSIRAYLDQLAEHLPRREVQRILPEIEGLLLDRVEAERASQPDLDQATLEARAVAAWDAPEKMAESLASTPLTIGLGTRRAYGRLLFALFAIHLLLSILLTVAGSEGDAVPGMLGPLETNPWFATLLSVAGIFFFDAGLLLVLFLVLGKGPVRHVPQMRLAGRADRREARLGLILMVLLLVIVNLFLPQIFSLRRGGEWLTFLSQDLLDVTPWLNLPIICAAVAYVLIILRRREGLVVYALGAVGSLLAAAWAVLAATRSELIRMPEGALPLQTAEVLSGLLERVFLIALIVMGILMALRFVKQALRAYHLSAR